jgi:hypothetical protein
MVRLDWLGREIMLSRTRSWQFREPIVDDAVSPGPCNGISHKVKDLSSQHATILALKDDEWRETNVYLMGVSHDDR